MLPGNVCFLTRVYFKKQSHHKVYVAVVLDLLIRWNIFLFESDFTEDVYLLSFFFRLSSSVDLLLHLVSQSESHVLVDSQREGEERKKERGVKKLNGPASSMSPVMEYNWGANGASLLKMERRRKTG